MCSIDTKPKQPTSLDGAGSHGDVDAVLSGFEGCGGLQAPETLFNLFGSPVDDPVRVGLDHPAGTASKGGLEVPFGGADLEGTNFIVVIHVEVSQKVEVLGHWLFRTYEEDGALVLGADFGVQPVVVQEG